MRKAIGGAILAILLMVGMAGAVYVGANSFTAPVPQADQDNCYTAAAQTGQKEPNCPMSETVWERGLRDPVAFYTLCLTWFTGVLAVLGIFQGFLTLQQINLSRDEFISSHRPKLRLRHLRMELPVLGEPMRLQFALSNIGDTPAKVAVADVTLIIANALPVLDEASGNMVNQELRTPVTFPVGSMIAAGDSITLKGTSDANFHGTADPPMEDWFATRTDVVGTITYADDLGTRRLTAFYRRCRELNRFEFRDGFSKAQKRDWEYED
jgi:hypothetical protein